MVIQCFHMFKSRVVLSCPSCPLPETPKQQDGAGDLEYAWVFKAGGYSSKSLAGILAVASKVLGPTGTLCCHLVGTLVQVHNNPNLGSQEWLWNAHF